MTPPDKDGNQIFWNKTETEGGTLFLPEDPNPQALELLVPDNYRAEVGHDGSCIGTGLLPQGPGIGHFEAGYVHHLEGFAMKTAPFRTQERMLDWLAANLMFRQAILSLAKDGEDWITKEILGLKYKIKTPQYFGALAVEETSGKSLISMSDESMNGAASPSEKLFGALDSTLLGTGMRVMGTMYPESEVAWDHWRRNWILDANSNSISPTLTRIDLFGTDFNARVFRPTVRF